MNDPLLLGLLFVASYFVGAIPFGVLVAKSRGVDIFKKGSGNPGATNVFRALGPVAGGIVFVLDVAKGLAPAFAARYVSHEQGIWFLVGIAAVIGHSFSPFVGFKGGKGVATALGAAFGAAPLVAAGAFVLFILIFLATGYVSLASLIASASTILLSAFIPGQSRWLIALFFVLWLLVMWRHRTNIQRLRAGTESKFSFKKKKKDDDPSA